MGVPMASGRGTGPALPMHIPMASGLGRVFSLKLPAIPMVIHMASG